MSRYWLLCALLAGATPATAHDWYPLECCHALDCAPVEKVDYAPAMLAGNLAATLPAGGTGALSASGSDTIASAPAPGATQGEALLPGAMLVTTRYGSVIVPANFPRRESKDHRMHACMRPGDGGTMRLICIFLPPSM
jgi:hypothetical protein